MGSFAKCYREHYQNENLPLRLLITVISKRNATFKKLHIFWGRVYVCENVPFPFSLIHSLTNYMYRSFWGHICTGGYGSHTGSFLTQKSSLMNRFQIWHCRDSVSFCIFQLKTFDDKVDLCTQKWASSVASVGWIRRQLSRVTWFL